MLISTFDASLTTDQTNSVCLEVAKVLVQEIYPLERREVVNSLIYKADFAALCNLEPNYDEDNVLTVVAIRQIAALFSKRIDLELDVDKEEAAWQKFEDSERACALTNECFRSWSRGRFQFHPRVEAVFHSAQRKIAKVLGDVPELSTLRFRFGPGATTQITRRNASPRYKLGERFACSGELSGHVAKYLEELPAWVFDPSKPEEDVATVPVEIHHGKLCFVPKNAKTYRSVVVEPSLNSFIQLGYGDYIAARLKKCSGIDITDQTRNQELARRGSIMGDLATLDLSSASDSIAIGLVAHLLPIEWFETLSAIRTGTVEIKGRTMKLQKFSSMGNGFTFPLETLIFWALADSCKENSSDVVSVYGDDIIVPVGAVPLLKSCLTAAGFTLNSSKSFWSGLFRESCGKDYFSGIPVRPVYLKDRFSGESVFILHNFFVRNRQLHLAELLRGLLDPTMILWGPDGYGDGHLISDQSIAHALRAHPRRKTHGYGGYLFDTYTWKGRKSYRPSPGDAVLPSYTTYVRNGSGSAGLQLSAATLARIGSARFAEYFGEVSLRRLISVLTTEIPTAGAWYRGGALGVTLPGKNGFKRISIYTLNAG